MRNLNAGYSSAVLPVTNKRQAVVVVRTDLDVKRRLEEFEIFYIVNDVCNAWQNIVLAFQSSLVRFPPGSNIFFILPNVDVLNSELHPNHITLIIFAGNPLVFIKILFIYSHVLYLNFRYPCLKIFKYLFKDRFQL